MKKRVIAFSLAFLMIFACVDSRAFAVGDTETAGSNENQTVVTTDQEEVSNQEEVNTVDENTDTSVEDTMAPETDVKESDETEESVGDLDEEQVDSEKENAKANVSSIKQTVLINPIQTAIDEAVSGIQTTVSITGNTVLETSIIIPAQKNIILNLNSYQLESSDETPLIIVEKDATLTLQGTGTILNSFENGVVIENNGTLNMTEGILKASGTGGMVVSKTENSQKGEGTYVLTSGSVVVSTEGTPVNSLKVIMLQAPTNLKSSNVSYQSIKLTWANPEGAKTYEVYRSTKKNTGFSRIATSTKKYYIDKKLTTGTTYYYKIKAVSDSANSAFSSTINCIPKPAATKSIRVVSTNYNTTRITWSKVSGATTYRIYRSTQEHKGYSRIATVKSATKYVDKGLENGVTYFYKVRACAGKVVGDSNQQVSTKVVIKRTTRVTAKSATNAINVNWKKVAGATKYVIYQSQNQNTGFKKIGTVSSKTLQYQATGLKAGTPYYYKIYTVRRGVLGKPSSVAYATPNPRRVTKLQVVSGGNRKATLTWSKANGAKNYRVYRSTKKSSGYKRIATVSSLKYSDTNLVNGTTYYYKIVSTNGKVRSTYSKAIAFTNAKRIKVSETSLSLKTGKAKTLKVTITPSAATTKTIKWSSSNTSVATVGPMGKVRAKAVGTAIITAMTANGRTAKCTVNVTNGVVVVLDPGHGGYDPGAVYNGVMEKDLNLKVSKYTQKELETYAGVQVYLTRTTDVFIPLADRSQFAQNKGASCLISQHFNASVAHTATGAGVFITVQNDYNGESKALGNKIISQIKSDIGISQWGTTGIFTRASATTPGKDYYSVIRGSVEKGFPGIIVENAFMDSSDYSKYLNSDAKLKKIGVSNARAIASYYGLSKK